VLGPGPKDGLTGTRVRPTWAWRGMAGRAGHRDRSYYGCGPWPAGSTRA